jgi:hypothetical protein
MSSCCICCPGMIALLHSPCRIPDRAFSGNITLMIFAGVDALIEINSRLGIR